MTVAKRKVSCQCGTCGGWTTHTGTNDRDYVACDICAAVRCLWSCGGDYPELSFAENQIINEARSKGFAEFWSAVPSAEAQARNTLTGAIEFLAAVQKARI